MLAEEYNSKNIALVQKHIHNSITLTPPPSESTLSDNKNKKKNTLSRVWKVQIYKITALLKRYMYKLSTI